MASKKSVSSKAGKQATKGKPAAKGKPEAKVPAKGQAKAKAPAKPAAKAKAPVKAKAAAKPKAAKAAPAPKAAKAAPASAPKAKPAKKGMAMVHWEIQSTQPEALHQFYGDVFGWQIDANNPMKYGMVSSKGAEGINGGIGGSQDGSPRLVVYASVPSITDTLERIEDLGGMTIMPRTDIGYVVMALYRDPEGNTMGLIEDR